MMAGAIQSAGGAGPHVPLLQTGCYGQRVNVERRDLVAGPGHQLHLRVAGRRPGVLIKTRCQGKMNLGRFGFFEEHAS